MSADPGPAERADAVRRYHERTKHYPTRFARSLGYLDWENQPNPFRVFEGARKITLPLVAGDDGPSFDALYAADGVAPRPLSAAAVGRMMELSFAVTAWKQHQSARWALRANPSSGNLHPTECYLLLPALPGLGESAALYHYLPEEHALEARASLTVRGAEALQRALPAGAFLLGLSSIHWREAWKYGERAYRYCQHDAGHAVAAARMAAAALGWKLHILGEPCDGDAAVLLGLDRAGDFREAEGEEPDLLALVAPGAATAPSIDTILGAAAGAEFAGRAAPLSNDHVVWEVIDLAAASARKERSVIAAPPALPDRDASSSARPLQAARVIRARRSAVAFDGTSRMPRDAFMRILSRTIPRAHRAPFDALAYSPAVHLAVFAHRVDGVAPGLYCVVRREGALDSLRARMRPSFPWKPADDALPIYQLQERDMRDWGRAISCDQGIAGDGAFSLGMIAEMDARFGELGAFAYRALHWEAGMIGQVLYLEAEAAGVRGTGIGCFFDDEMHGVLGLRGGALQTIYHFAVGTPVDDPRLSTLPAYDRARYDATSSQESASSPEAPGASSAEQLKPA